MTKHLIPFLFIVLIFTFSCNVNNNNTANETADTALLLVATFDTAAPYYVEKPVWIEGTVTHTCKHGGKRMFIADGNDSIMVEITTGPDIVKFDDGLAGSRVHILGTVKEERIDDKYLNEWEAEILKPEESHETGLHSGAKGHEDQPNDSKLEQIKSLREQLKSSGKDHLSFFSVEAISFQEIPPVNTDINVKNK